MKNSVLWKRWACISILIIFTSFFVGCGAEDEFPQDDVQNQEGSAEIETHEVFTDTSGEFSITATDLWVFDAALHEESSLSLYNEEYQSYPITLFDEKLIFPDVKSLDYYSELAGESTRSDLKDGSITEMEQVTVDGMNGKKFDITGDVEDVSVTYKFLVLEDDTNFYQVIMWSFTENIQNNQEYYEDILLSFQSGSEASDEE
ncbi:MAG TPA: hypothetical protein VK861_01700 [Bacteroidales bacterium]|nr:hypothetical protein [Bacteroidales bacterium]